jgi:hypothetical protein
MRKKVFVLGASFSTFALAAGCGSAPSSPEEQSGQIGRTDSALLAIHVPVPGEYGGDGSHVTVTRAADGSFVSATGIDFGGTQHALYATHAYANSAAAAGLFYYENGALVFKLSLSLSPTGAFWHVKASAVGRSIDYVVGFGLVAVSGPSSVTGTATWYGSTVTLDGSCDILSSFCPTPAVYAYFSGELGRLAYFAQQIREEATAAQGRAASGEWYSGLSPATLFRSPFCQYAGPYYDAPGSPGKLAAYVEDLALQPFTPCQGTGTLDCTALQWLGGVDGDVWSYSYSYGFQCGGGGTPRYARCELGVEGLGGCDADAPDPAR